MNLVDAIRVAAQKAQQHENGKATEGAVTILQTPVKSAAEAPSKVLTPSDLENESWASEATTGEPETATEATLSSSEDAPLTLSNTVMKLEISLGPEQLHALLGAIVHTHHSVMTLKEAASYLRISGTKLEQLAGERTVPAFQIDGRWRFSRSALDQWLNGTIQREGQAS